MKMIRIFIQVRRIDKRLLVSEFISWYCLKATYVTPGILTTFIKISRCAHLHLIFSFLIWWMERAQKGSGGTVSLNHLNNFRSSWIWMGHISPAKVLHWRKSKNYDLACLGNIKCLQVYKSWNYRQGVLGKHVNIVNVAIKPMFWR